MKILVQIALIALLWIITIQGNFGSINGDTNVRLHMAHAWWTGAEEVQLPPEHQSNDRADINFIANGVRGVDGKRYVTYDVGQSLLMLPGDWLGTQLHQWFPALTSELWRQLTVAFLIFVPLNVATVVTCFWLLRLFDFNQQIAGLASITWLLGTTVLHYAQMHHQNSGVLLFVLFGYATAFTYVQRPYPKFALLSGLALGASLLIRLSSVVHVLTVFLFLVGCIFFQSRNTRKVLNAAGWWMIGFIPLTLLQRIIDYRRYGSFLATGQAELFKAYHDTTDPLWAGLPVLSANYPFMKAPLHGIIAVLFSPTKSIFLYDPLLLPCLILGILLWKKLSPYMQWYLITGFLNLGLFMVITMRLDFWHGDWSWGARYHVTSVHLLLIPLVALLIQHILFSKRFTAWLMGGILAIAIAVQFASVMMPYSLEISQAQVKVIQTTPKFQFRLGQRFINIACLVNNSFSKDCINETSLTKLDPDQRSVLSRFNRLSFLPFQIKELIPNNPNLSAQLSIITLIIWVLLLLSALSVTIYFSYQSWILIKGINPGG